METYTIDEVTGRLEVTITSRTPYPGPTETVLTMITMNGTAQGNITDHGRVHDNMCKCHRECVLN